MNMKVFPVPLATRLHEHESPKISNGGFEAMFINPLENWAYFEFAFSNCDFVEYVKVA